MHDLIDVMGWAFGTVMGLLVILEVIGRWAA